MPVPKPPITNQRMFHGTIRCGALAGQLAARFNDRQHRTSVQDHGDTAIIQIGSKFGTPLTLNMADTEGGVMVTASRGRDWLDKAGAAGEILDRASKNPWTLLTVMPDIIGEMRKDNLVSRVWNAINDIMAMSRALAGEEDAPQTPVVCPFCGRPNDPGSEECGSCGGPLPVILPRICPKCGRSHTSDALFCQACGTRLIEQTAG